MRRLTKKIFELVLSVLPYVIVATLLFVAVFVKPKATGETISPPPIERRDRFFGVVAPEKNVIWAAGSMGKVVRSDDEGKTFVLQNTPTAANLQGIAAWDARRALVVGNGGVVIVTEDGGKTWKEKKAPLSAVANKFLRVKAYPGGKAWIVGEMGAVLFSSDYGEMWVRKVEEKDVGLNDICFSNSRIGWIVGEKGKILHTADGGDTWKEINSPTDKSLMSVAFRDDNNGVCVGLEGAVLVTSNAGKTWNPVDSATKNHLFGVTWNGHGWLAVGGKGILLAGDESGRKWRVTNLSDSDLASHTEVLWAWDSAYVGGGTLGRWKDGKWNIFGTVKKG